MMKKYFKQEILYGINSKSYFVITILLVVLFGGILFLNYSSVTDSYNNYKKTEDYYKKNNLDIQKDLSGTYNVEQDGNSGKVSNPILYYKVTVSKYAYAASPRYTLSQLLEASVALFPLVFGVLGLVVATHDFKYKTIKLKTARMNKWSLGISKQLSIAFISFFILAAALAISYVIGSFMYSGLSSAVPLDQFKSSVVPTKSPMMTKFIFGYATALIFAEIGYTLGMLFKNISVGIIAIVIYTFVYTKFGQFGLKNSLYYFQKKLFDFYGVVSAVQPSDKTTTPIAVLIVVLVVAILIITNMIVLVKRSSYES